MKVVGGIRLAGGMIVEIGLICCVASICDKRFYMGMVVQQGLKI